MSGNGYMIVFGNSKENRISFSFSLVKEDNEYTRLNASVTHSINNSSESVNRNLNQTVKHNDKLKVIFTKTSVSLVFGESKFELVYDENLGSTATANSATVYLSVSQTATDTLMNYTFQY